MKAVGYFESGSIDRPDALLDLQVTDPQPGPTDLLVAVAAVSVNPIDTKIRVRRPASGAEPVILGWDAVGEVVACGAQVTGFRPGDRVFYAGALNRPGSNATLQAVDYRIAAIAPASCDDAAAAALPLTSITAWEILFDRLSVPQGGGRGQVLLVLGGAGGVGSILIQLARALTELTVVATASRPASSDWVTSLGAHAVVDPHVPWLTQLQAVGLPGAHLLACLTHTQDHWGQVLEVAMPQGAVAVIDDPGQPLDTNLMKPKSLSLRWESMFTRSTFQTPDMAEQGHLLGEVAALVDAGRLRTTLAVTNGPINAANLIEAHRAIEGGASIGKRVLVGW